MSRPAPLWTLENLVALAAAVLRDSQVGQGNGQVAELPTVRTVRFYTTLGLLDRPAEMRGRTAFYGPTHLMQVVAIKRLQAQGLPLASVQERLLGITRARLASLARLPEVLPNVDAPEVAPLPVKPGPSRRDGAFWEAAPSSAEPVQHLASLLQTVPLHMDVSLTATTSRPLTREDVMAIKTAAQGLLDTLMQRGLIATVPDTTKEQP